MHASLGGSGDHCWVGGVMGDVRRGRLGHEGMLVKNEIVLKTHSYDI